MDLKERINYLEETNEKPIIVKSKDPVWLESFSEYNRNNKMKLGLGCPPCYLKVISYFKSKLK